LPDEDKEEKARYYFKLLSEEDENIKKLWLIFRYLSLKEFERLYEILGIKFDTTLGEAFAEKYAELIVKDLEKK
jgi:arginyl-tRNA synthetase